MSPTSGPGFLHLAPELVENVIKQLDSKYDLSNVRLTCKTLEEHAVKKLFKNAFVCPREYDIVRWNAISNNDVIRQIPRHAMIHTDQDIEYRGYREPSVVDIDADDALILKKALAALSRFPNLESLEIGFTPECVGQEDDLTDVMETLGEREEKLSLIFQAIAHRAADKANKTIRKLTIINLQNAPIPKFTSSDLFRDVMGQLEELHISMVQEYNEEGPDYDFTKIELQTFPPYFRTHWLELISANLRALSIYTESHNWGPLPGYFDLSGIAFPRLETLALGYYTLAHDDSLDWVLAIKSLRRLILHNCMIASYICISTDCLAAWKPPMHDWISVPNDDEADDNWRKCFAYNGTWSQHLDRIAEALPKLVDFRFGYGSTHGYEGVWSEPRYGITHRDSCPTEIFQQRYITFDNDVLPTVWQDTGVMHSWLEDDFLNLHKNNLDADQTSLDALLRKIWSRR